MDVPFYVNPLTASGRRSRDTNTLHNVMIKNPEYLFKKHFF